MASPMDLSVSIFNDTEGDQEFIVYQQNVVTNVKNYLTAAWEYEYLTNGGAQWDFVVPFEIEVSGIEDALSIGTKTTNLLVADYNDQFQLSESTISPASAFKITKSGTGAGQNTINILNTVVAGPRWAVVNKNGQPLFTSLVAPNQSVNFAVMPTLYVAIASNVQKGDLFQSINLTQSWAFPYEGFTSLKVYASENTTTKEITLTGELGK
jgi:hypothetical protein